MFQDIAAGVLEAALPCEFAVPDPPPGQTLDLASGGIVFTPGMGMPQQWQLVTGPSQCGPDKFYIQGTTIFLCPEACDVAEADPSAKLEVMFDCF